MTVNQASDVSTCPNCSKELDFIHINNGAWRVGYCEKCWAMPIFCVDCQKWSMVSYTGSNNSYNWSCRSCGEDNIGTVTTCIRQ